MDKNTFLKKIISLFMIMSFTFSNTMLVVNATDISGVTPNGNVYNIEAQKFSGSTQFRQYNNFELSQGDVANLIFKLGYQNFVNLVNNQVNINGIVNTMQGNNFYNGHAIFVSPQGMVVGASGVLNVGSLSVLTPTSGQYNSFLGAYNSGNLDFYEVGKTQYNNLIQDSQGNILVNGKIIAREGVNLYGSDITVKKDTGVAQNNTAGIIAGYKGTSPMYNVTDAEAVFNSLVSNNQINANGLELDSKGNIKLVANKSIAVNSDNLGDHTLIPTLSKNAETVETSINLDNAIIASGNDIIASSVATHTIELKAGELESGLNIKTIQDPLSLIGANLNENFEGARANSTIDIINNSKIYSKHNTSLTSNAVTDFVVSNDTNAAKYIYALGTETSSEINIKDSIIEAGNDFISKAFSENKSNFDLNNNLVFTSNDNDSDNNMLLFVNQTTKADTSTTTDNSKIKAKNISLISRNYNKDNINITTQGQTKDKTGYAVSALIKNQQIDTVSSVKNKSELTSQKGVVDVTSQNLSIVKNNVDLSINNNDTSTTQSTADDNIKNILDGLKEQMNRATQDSTSNTDHGKNAIDKITGSTPTPQLAANSPLMAGSDSDGSSQIGGTLILNRSNINTKSLVDDSTIIGAANTYILANVVDLTSNISESSTEGTGTFGAGLAVTANMANKNTLATVLNNSSITSDGLFLNATTELPMNHDALKLALKMSGLENEIVLDSNVASQWDMSSTSIFDEKGDSTATGSDATNVTLLAGKDDDISYTEFFHNVAKSSAESDSYGISASYVYNTLLNNTEAKIDSSVVNVTNGDVGLNAVNSITNYNGVGAVDFIMAYLTEDGNKISVAESANSDYAIGGAVLTNFIENNAKAFINNSNVIATKSDINLTTSNEQSYISATAMGAEGTTLAIEGSVVVQTIGGETNSKILNSNNISANNINVNAGTAMFNAVSKVNAIPVLNADTGLIKFNDTRISNDKILDTVLSGATMCQSVSNGSSESGTAVGAAVNVNNINRILNASIESSIVSALESVNVNSITYTQGVNVAIAGMFKGGVSTNKKYQENANSGMTSQEDTNGAQELANYGGWINDLDTVAGDDSTLTKETDAYKQTTTDAPKSTVTDALSGNSTQEAMTSTTSKVVTEEVPVIDESTGQPMVDSQGNAITTQETVMYKPNEDGYYVDENGNTIDGQYDDGQGGKVKKPVKVEDGVETTDLSTELANLSGSSSGSSLTGNTATSSTGKSNFSNAVAGAVNVYINNSEAKAKVTDSTINVGKTFNVTAEHSSQIINNANCKTKASTFGAGGAVNVGTFKERISALLDDSTINKSSNKYDVNVKASDYNSVTDEATGSGSTSSNSGGTKVAIGGSFNVSTDESSAIAQTVNSQINEANNVSVISDNYIDLYKKAGNTQTEKSSGTTVGAGLSGNINILKDTSIAEINGSNNIDSNDLLVIANSKDTQNSIIRSVAIGGAVITGGSSSSFSIVGTTGTDIIENTITAQVLNAQNISSTGDVKIKAISGVKISNLCGSLTVSTSTKGAGVGIGAIVEVYDNHINAKIEDTTIASCKSFDIGSTLNEELKFIAVNLGIETSGAWTINVNGIVNVIQDKINAYITDSNITTDGNFNFESLHDVAIEGLTVNGNGSTKGAAIGGTAVVNVLDSNSETIANAGSSILSGGDITVSDYIEEFLDINSAGVTASSSGAVGIAANANANVVTNISKAIFSADVLNSKSVSVSATDLFEAAERNLVVGATGGSFGLGGVVTVDVMDKTVESKINGNSLSSTGVVSAIAKSENVFGAQKNPEGGYYEKAIGNIKYILDEADKEGCGVGELNSMLYWQYAFNGSGAATVGINETVIVKTIENDVQASIEKANITSGGVGVLASDYSINNALVGDVAGSSGALSVGGGEYINVLSSNTFAKIYDGVTISSTGDINVEATNKEVLRDIIVAAGGAGKVTINGAATVNIVEDQTNAIVGNNVNITKANNISVIASNITDTESADVAAAGSGTAQIGGVFKFNQFKAKTNAKIDGTTKKATVNKANGDILVEAGTEEDFSAMMYSVGGAGKASVNGIAVVNILESETNAIINASEVVTEKGKIDVKASHDFNPGNEQISADLLDWMKNNQTSVDTAKFINDAYDTTSGKYFAPLVTSLEIGGAGTAAIAGNITSNNFYSKVNAKVYDSTISSLNSMNLDATQTLSTFDAMAGILGAGTVGVVINGVVNVIEDETRSIIDNTTVTKGGGIANAYERMNINTGQFAVGGSAAVAIMTAVNVNVIDNIVEAAIKNNSDITGDSGATSAAETYINNMFVIAGGSANASIMLAPVVNYFIGDAKGYIEDSQLKSGENTVGGTTYFQTSNLVAAGSLALTGAAINAIAIVNDLIYNTNGYINNTAITDAVSTDVHSYCESDMYGFAASLAITIIGGSIPANGIVSVYDNKQNSYITDSSIEKGSVSSDAKNVIIVETSNGSYGITAEGAGLAASGLVNVFNSKTHSYMYNTSTLGTTNTSIIATSVEDIINNNFGAAIGIVGGGIAASALVNVIENETLAYIDTEHKDVKSTGKMLVKADDNFKATNMSGVLGGGAGALTGNVNVNELNNVIKAYIDTESDGSVEAGSVDVLSNMSVGMTNEVDSIAVGIGTIAGDVAVTIIGGNIDISGYETTQADLYEQLQGGLDEMNDVAEDIGTQIKMNTQQAEGVVSYIGGNLKTKDSINVSATNKLKGYDDYNDIYRSCNHTISAAGVGVAAGVHYTELKYNTNASIVDSIVESTNGNITVNSDNTIRGQSDMYQTGLTGASLDAVVAYFLVKSLTQSTIGASTVKAAGNIDVFSNAYSNIIASGEKGKWSIALDYTLGLVNTEDDSHVASKISGDVDIKANKINVITTTGADLYSSLDMNIATAVGIKTVFNTVTTDIIADALIDAVGDMKFNDMTISVKNKNINLTDTYYTSTLSAVEANADESGAVGNLTYTSGIDSTNLNISGYNSDYAKNINIYNGVSASDNTVAGKIYTTMITDTSSVSAITGSGIVKDAISNLTTDTNINSGTGTIKTENMNVASMADRVAKIDESKGAVNAIDVSVYTLRGTAEGDNTIDFAGNNLISNALNITMNDNAQAYTKITSGKVSILVDVNPLYLTSTVDTTTAVTLAGNLTAGQMAINNNINRYAYTSADSSTGGAISVNVMNMDAINKGSSSLNIGFTTPDGYDYVNAMDFKNTINNLTETYLTEEHGGLVAVQAGRCNNKLDATNSLNIENANIKSTGDVKIGVTNNNNMIRRQDSGAGGVVVVASEETVNTIDSNTNFTIKNSNIEANNIELYSTSFIGDPNCTEAVKYVAYEGGFVAQDWTKITTNITQNNNLEIIDSTLKANKTFVSNVSTDSIFKALMDIESDGFVAGAAPRCYITAKNYNYFTNDKDSSIIADYVYINMNSSNNLDAQARTNLEGFSSTVNANPDAQSNLYVTNTINNNGLIQSGVLTQLDYMTDSTNNLKQYTYAEIDCAMPFGGVDGSVTTSLKNILNIPTDAMIVSGQNVIGNFAEGTMNIDSLSEDDITCRMLFGIPIGCSDDPKSIYSRTWTNNMNFDGKIIAQAGNQKYMVIDKDGNVTKSIGFANSDYELIDTGKILGDKTQEGLIAYLERLQIGLQNYINLLKNEQSENNAQIAADQAQIAENDRQLGYLDGDESYNITPALLEQMIYNYERSKLVLDSMFRVDGKISSYQYDMMINYFQNTKTEASPTEQDLINYMTSNGFRDDQIDAVLEARNREISFIHQADGFKYQEYRNPDYVGFIMFDDELDARIKFHKSNNEIMNQEISALTQKNANIDNLIANANEKLEIIANDLEIAQNTDFFDKEFADKTFVFKNMESTSGQIQLTYLPNTNIVGAGQFVLADSGMEIHNYSPYSLLFLNITQATGDMGLIINGKNYNDGVHTNTGNVVNCADEDHHGYPDPAGSGPTLTTDYSSVFPGFPTIFSGISIKNYFDHNNPGLDKMYGQSDIYFLGAISTYLDLFIWNESGDVIFSHVLDVQGNEKIYATQNDIKFLSNQMDIIIDADDIINAGKNVVFNSKSLVNNGSIIAGRNKRTLTITEDMLDDDKLIFDPATDIQNMINIGYDSGNDVSPYLNEIKDNIKALYKNDEILVFGVEQEGGQFISRNTPTGTGTILTTNGYSDIDIINNTAHNIVIRKLKNNYMWESIPNSQLSIRQPVYSTATTDIISKNGAIGLNGYIQNAYKTYDDYGTGILNLDGKKISIADYIKKGTQEKAIEAFGDMNIIAQNGIDIAGSVYQRNGNSTIDNDTANSSLTTLMMMVPSVSDGILLQATGIVDTEGNVIFTNTTGAGGINLNGSITNTGNTTITNGDADNTGIKSLSILGTVDNKNGTLDITNYGAENIQVTREGVQATINQGINILGTVSNKGDTTITTNNGIIRVPVEGTSITDMQQGKIINEGELNIKNLAGLGINIEGEITNQNKTINIENGVAGQEGLTTGSGIRISNRVFDDKTVSQAIIQNTANTTDAIRITNYGKWGLGINGIISNTGTGDVVIDNLCNTSDAYGIRMTTDGVIENSEGDLYITNHGQAGGITLLGKIDVPLGDVIIEDDSEIKHGITISTIDKREGDIILYNEGTEARKGITILGQLSTDDGNIYIYNQDSDITFGFLGAYHQDDDDGFIVTNHGNVVITLKNGSIINTLTDAIIAEHSNYDMAEGYNNCYRTMIVAKGKEDGLGNLTISVLDGNIGEISALKGDKAGDINSGNLDYRDSINVNVEGAINLFVRNSVDNQNEHRVVNLRAKQSDLNIRHALVQGDMILSAPDWQQADNVDPKTEPDYYKGYSVLLTDDGVLNGVTANNLTVIASDHIGSEGHPFVYVQTQNLAKTQKAAFEAENDIYLLAKGNFDNDININQIVSKQGDLNLRFINGSNIEHIASAGGNVTLHLCDTTFIDTIGSGNHLEITQDKGNLFINTIGGDAAAFNFSDILYPHDKILLTAEGGIPQTIDIEVNGDDSTLLVYNTYVKGANNGVGAYDEYGNKLTDVKLAAHNIITSATDIPKSIISSKKHPNGFAFKLPRDAKGIQTYGEGTELALELTGKDDSVSDNIIASVNSQNSRGVIFNKLYSNDAYINTKDKDLDIVDGYINNYAEIRTGNGNEYNDKFAIVDNDYRRLIYSRENPASIQLYTALTGNFALDLNETIKMYTNAPVVHYDPYKLVNRYSDQNSFYNLGMKETSVQQNFVKHKKDMEITIPRLDYTRVMAFDVLEDTDLISNVKIYKISRTGASIQNDGTLKVKNIIPVDIKCADDDINVTVDAKVVRIDNDVAEIKFVNMPDSTANKIMYRCLKKANTKNLDLTMNIKKDAL